MSTYIKCKEVRHIEAQQIENLFAGNIRNLLMDAKLDYDKLYEIRLRVGRPLFLTYDGGECFLRKPGQEQYLVTTEDLKETLEYVTGYSLYAYEDEIRQCDDDGNTYDFANGEDVYDENGVDYYYHGEPAYVRYMPKNQ